MNGEELQMYINKDPTTKDKTWGVFARDKLPEENLLPGAYIVNSHNAPGHHWFLLYVGEESVELFDSLGKPARDYNLSVKCISSNDRVQPKNSSSCGLYVLYFVYWRCRGIPMNTLYQSLRENGEETVNQHLSYLKNL